MKLNKKLMVLAAVGALSATTATSAMAFENEFHGMYKLKYFLTNYENGGFGFINPNAENRKASNYFEQRARIFYTAKANDDLKLVTAFEIDSVFGDKAQGQATRGSGGALESDAVNLETKYVYLDFKIPSTPVKVTVGIQPYKDAFKGIFLDADIAGVNTVTKFGPATIAAGYFRAYDQSYFNTAITTRGTDDLDIVALSGDYNINKNFKVGAAYYLYSDNRNSAPTKLHVFGANADAKIGKLGLSGFAAMQQGVTNGAAARTTFNGYAFNAAAKLPIGPGSLRTAALYTTGDDGRDNINTGWQAVQQTQNLSASAQTNTYNESNMMLLNRAANMGGTTTDNNLINSTNNRDQGMILASLGYDATITPKLYANANVGFAWAAKNNNTTRSTAAKSNGTNFQGTEVNIETGYKMYDNLTASVQAAYLILGGYYTDTVTGGKDPEDPYTARVVLSYVF
jgi:hypothetical protein